LRKVIASEQIYRAELLRVRPGVHVKIIEEE